MVPGPNPETGAIEKRGGTGVSPVSPAVPTPKRMEDTEDTDPLDPLANLPPCARTGCSYASESATGTTRLTWSPATGRDGSAQRPPSRWSSGRPMPAGERRTRGYWIRRPLPHRRPPGSATDGTAG